MNLRTWWQDPTPEALAAQELAEAELALLNAYSGRDYATAIVSYNEARIKRLSEFLAKLAREPK